MRSESTVQRCSVQITLILLGDPKWGPI